MATLDTMAKNIELFMILRAEIPSVLKRSPALLGGIRPGRRFCRGSWGCSIRGDVGLLLAPSFLRRRSISQLKGRSIGFALN
jgi:hypothetical protein